MSSYDLSSILCNFPPTLHFRSNGSHFGNEKLYNEKKHAAMRKKECRVDLNEQLTLP